MNKNLSPQQLTADMSTQPVQLLRLSGTFFVLLAFASLAFFAKQKTSHIRGRWASCKKYYTKMSDIIIKPIGYVKNNRIEPIDDNWSLIESIIELADDLPDECFDGIEDFSHLEIIYYFDKSTKTFIGSEHPRENKDYPKVGIFAQRKKDRPNHIGATIVNLICRDGRKLIVKNLDAINGTPIIDIKPVFMEYLPNGEVKQPNWVKDLMRNYW